MALMKDYFEYFEHLAENHPQILHGSEGAGETFAMMEISEALGDFRSSIKSKGAVCRLIRYDGNVSDSRTQEVENEVYAGFLILCPHSNRNAGRSSHLAALDKAQEIVDDFIERIILDSQNGHPLFNHSLDSDQDFKVRNLDKEGHVGSYVGWLVLFTFQYHFAVCDDNQAGWLDGATTDF